MSHDSALSHFAEKSGVVACHTPWGRWWQSVHEVHVEVNLPPQVAPKDVNVHVKTRDFECLLQNEVLFKVNYVLLYHIHLLR